MYGRVLVVEDDFELRQYLELMLEQGTYHVMGASDAFEALILAERHEFDAAICDIALPGMDGLQLIERWNSQGVTFPILVYSANLTRSIAARALELGVSDIVAKPSPAPIIQAKLSMAIDEARRKAAS